MPREVENLQLRIIQQIVQYHLDRSAGDVKYDDDDPIAHFHTWILLQHQATAE